MDKSTKNRKGIYVPATPEPYYGFRKKCPDCGKGFFTLKGYQQHYALEHILEY